MATFVIVGATSGLGRAIAAELARRKQRLILSGRDTESLAADAADLLIRHGCDVDVVPLDLTAVSGHAAWWRACLNRAPDEALGVVLCTGYLGDGERAPLDRDLARRIVEINYTACVALLDVVAAELAERRRGSITVIGSVAGDRGRAGNYHYGSAKAGLAVYLQGLRGRLAEHGVRVVTVKPGLIDTRMTWGRPALPLI
ncbi:MAG TPA: SDR family NAD(P)-dependent oxidoreductase, partial [Limnochordia bacterium]|nr:SDR family NAD(P)-dependent oxidoreductase [Limnochordia bacterium]